MPGVCSMQGLVSAPLLRLGGPLVPPPTVSAQPSPLYHIANLADRPTRASASFSDPTLASLPALSMRWAGNAAAPPGPSIMIPERQDSAELCSRCAPTLSALHAAGTGPSLQAAVAGAECLPAPMPGQAREMALASLALLMVAGNEANEVSKPAGPAFALGPSITCLDAGTPLYRRNAEEEAHDAQPVHHQRGVTCLPKLMRGLPPGLCSAPEMQSLQGCTLVTGGMSGLGWLTTCFLLSKGPACPEVLLAGRSGRLAGRLPGGGGVFATPDHLHLVQWDVGRRGEVASLSQIARHPLSNTVHAAGVLDDGMLASQTPGRFRTVAAPKLQGAVMRIGCCA